jgi:hypothetical protein
MADRLSEARLSPVLVVGDVRTPGGGVAVVVDLEHREVRHEAVRAGAWPRDVQGTPGTLEGPRGYTLVFDRRWIQDRAPGTWDPNTSPETGFGGVVDNDWIPGATTFEIAGSVTFRVLRDDAAEGGWWCEPCGPKATYSWSVSGDRLTLGPVSGVEPCRERGAVYTGAWTRVR